MSSKDWEGNWKDLTENIQKEDRFLY